MLWQLILAASGWQVKKKGVTKKEIEQVISRYEAKASEWSSPRKTGTAVRFGSDLSNEFADFSRQTEALKRSMQAGGTPGGPSPEASSLFGEVPGISGSGAGSGPASPRLAGAGGTADGLFGVTFSPPRLGGGESEPAAAEPMFGLSFSPPPLGSALDGRGGGDSLGSLLGLGGGLGEGFGGSRPGSKGGSLFGGASRDWEGPEVGDSGIGTDFMRGLESFASQTDALKKQIDAISMGEFSFG